MKIYISGKITGLNITEVSEKFGHAENVIRQRGHEPVNPIKASPFSDEKRWHDYMMEDIAILFKCDAIFMLPDWGQSKGARIEYAIAKELGLHVFFNLEDIPNPTCPYCGSKKIYITEAIHCSRCAITSEF